MFIGVVVEKICSIYSEGSFLAGTTDRFRIVGIINAIIAQKTFSVDSFT